MVGKEAPVSYDHAESHRITGLSTEKIAPNRQRQARSAVTPTRFRRASLPAQPPADVSSRIGPRRGLRFHRSAIARRRKTKWRSFQNDACFLYQKTIFRITNATPTTHAQNRGRW